MVIETPGSIHSQSSAFCSTTAMDKDQSSLHHEAHVQSMSKASSNHPFLNHSAITLPNNLPPNADERLLARHKRRRTSPEDQVVLEVAYNRDPKPDKTARLELVKQVALGEKEVQIWFQNRRQTSRRKTRPLLPHEIVQYQLSRSRSSFEAGSPQLAYQLIYDEVAQSEVLVTAATTTTNEEHQLPSHENGTETTREGQLDVGTSASYQTPSQTSTQTSCPVSSRSTSSQVFLSGSQNQKPSVRTTEPSRPIGYLSTRRSAPSLHTDCSDAFAAPEQHVVIHHDSEPRLKKTSSLVRLSLSSEGKAQITTKDGSSPSPPRAPQVGNNTSSIGQQVPHAPGYAPDVIPFKPLKKSFSGRSRDSRAWEFWCDRDARGELGEKAEKDASGSAADAIDLLRSNSGRRVLGTLPAKRNSLVPRHSALLKRPRLDGKPSLLQRSSTSLGRLQSKAVEGAKWQSKPATQLKHDTSPISVYIPGNDSDKENWSPKGTESSAESASDHDVLTDGHSFRHSAGSGYHGGKHSYTREPSSFASNEENYDPEADPELSAFMRGGESSKVSKEEELDCIQNLLSLSQGNWR